MHCSCPQLRQDRLLEDARAIANGQIVSAAADERSEEMRNQLAEVYAASVDFWSWIVAIAAVVIALLTFIITNRQIAPRFRARNKSEWIIQAVLLICATIAILTTIGIVLSLIGETARFFSQVPITSFLFGTHWSPLSGVFEGKMDPSFGGRHSTMLPALC